MPTDPEAKRRQIATKVRLAARTLDALKLASGCVDCGYREHPAALQFDHVDPATKRRDLGWQVDRTRLTSDAKLTRYLDHVQAYCQVRCANCHAVRSFTEGHHLRGTAQRTALTTATLF